LGRIGTTELIVIFIIALLVFGPSKLPELGRIAGRTIGSIKKYVNNLENELELEENVTEKSENINKDKKTVKKQDEDEVEVKEDKTTSVAS